ncbi:hypothetical protein [Rhizobium leguminosarum]|uniref:hypothetical protein n=1 Tax=Rhizobium leguminosarum TaxID=384 RepID=UPI001C94A8E4|nr:hypothetical protein [Rhizobium leguminosarum]MBY5797773.1 hypothetical protein [Rhizobium leguminosarum]
MNTKENITSSAGAPAPRKWLLPLLPIDALVTAHITAVTNHERIFKLEDWGLVESERVSGSIRLIDNAMLALCTARPTEAPQIALRRSYLISTLPDYVDGSNARANAVFEALLD